MILNALSSRFNVSNLPITSSPTINKPVPTVEEKRWAKRETEAILRRVRELEPFIYLHEKDKDA